jgi:hypothetical protein
MNRKYLKNLLLATVAIAGLSVSSCGKNNGQEVGTEDASTTNGDVSGSKETMDNEDSGRAAGEGADGVQTPTDTVANTNTHSGH